jgi:hypothetical protein
VSGVTFNRRQQGKEIMNAARLKKRAYSGRRTWPLRESG